MPAPALEEDTQQFTGNNAMITESELRQIGEMSAAEGEYAMSASRHVPFIGDRAVEHVALRAFQGRIGRDDIGPAPDEWFCQRCQRRGIDYERQRLCAVCHVAWRGQCSFQKHSAFARWSYPLPARGTNCPSCNLWLPAYHSAEFSPYPSPTVHRLVDADIELGAAPMRAIKRMLAQVLPPRAPETLAHLRDRIGDSPIAIPAGDANPLYTATLHLEEVLNTVASQGDKVTFTEEQAARYEHARHAIRVISRALHHSGLSWNPLTVARR